jgi:anti-sigma regulatory factor (Ser/Thr protein kinase)
MALDRAFDAGTLSNLRTAVLAEAAAAGMSGDRAADVVLTVHELAANAVCHGAGAGQLAMLVRNGRLYCQVSDVGRSRADRRAAGNGLGPVQPWPVHRGHGLWLVHATADQVSVSFGSSGSQVTAVFVMKPAAFDWPIFG